MSVNLAQEQQRMLTEKVRAERWVKLTHNFIQLFIQARSFHTTYSHLNPNLNLSFLHLVD